MSENQNEPIEVDEVVDVPVETVEDSHEWDDEPVTVDLEATAKKSKAKAVKHRVLFTSPFGRKGNIVTVDPKDPRVVRLLANGGLEKV